MTIFSGSFVSGVITATITAQKTPINKTLISILQSEWYVSMNMASFWYWDLELTVFICPYQSLHHTWHLYLWLDFFEWPFSNIDLSSRIKKNWSTIFAARGPNAFMLPFHIYKHFPPVWFLISTLMVRNSFIGGRKRHLGVEFILLVFHVEYFCTCWLYISCNIVMFSEQEEVLNPYFTSPVEWGDQFHMYFFFVEI